jgi:hypothetical protein
MTTPIDETKVGLVMRDMLNSGTAQKPPVDPSELRRRATRRGLRRVDTKVFITVAAVAAVIVTLIVVGPLRSDNPPSRPPTATHPNSTTTTSTTTTTTVPVAAASKLDAYFLAEQQTDSAAYTQYGESALLGYTPFVSVHSAPVADDGRTVALAAFSYDPGGHPVQILIYRDGQWTLLAGLAAPNSGGSTATNDPPSLAGLAPDPVGVADVTGDGQPDFLVMESAADNVPGFVVSQDGGAWRYIPFLGPYAPSPDDVMDREPTFNGNTLESDYNNCVPDCAGGQNTTIVWTYKRSTGEFTAPNPPGYVG